jgi:hypothetical protein
MFVIRRHPRQMVSAKQEKKTYNNTPMKMQDEASCKYISKKKDANIENRAQQRAQGPSSF